MARRGAAAPQVVLFARLPRMGQVKTRLARDIGPVGALAFYRTQLVRSVRLLGRDPRWQTVLAATPRAAVPAFAKSLPPTMRCVAQCDGDLGKRMRHVFVTCPPGPLLILGTDVPGVSREQVAAAFRALRERDAVFGPAEDGGYWLIGLSARARRRLGRLFAGVRWSSEYALADTEASLDPARRTAYLPMLADIDTGADYRAWKADLRADQTAGSLRPS